MPLLVMPGDWPHTRLSRAVDERRESGQSQGPCPPEVDPQLHGSIPRVGRCPTHSIPENVRRK
jgi:hypothetical protein